MRTPEERAAVAYNSGVQDMKKADEYEAAAAKETDPKAQDKAHRKAHYSYLSARNEFQDATRLVPNVPEAWNNLGYTQRKLGSYDAALAAYERALTLRPGFPEALEYRGEAYLGLNRIADAKQVYLDLFASNRALSDQFMTAIKRYIDDHRKSGSPDGPTLDELAAWVQERSQIAAQTAALTREGTAASWQ
jgi:tetratricopeptide (TPR) repeat protein